MKLYLLEMTLQQPLELDLAGFLPYRLSVLANRVSRILAADYSARFGLTVPEWRVMAVLGQWPGASADAVCRHTEMDKVTVSRAVTRLRRRGLLRREIAAEDRRRSVLRLSASGAALHARIVPLALAYEQRLTEVLSASEHRALQRLLDKLGDRARAMASTWAPAAAAAGARPRRARRAQPA